MSRGYRCPRGGPRRNTLSTIICMLPLSRRIAAKNPFLSKNTAYKWRGERRRAGEEEATTVLARIASGRDDLILLPRRTCSASSVPRLLRRLPAESIISSALFYFFNRAFVRSFPR